jgi:hypothetical protein
MLSGSGWQGMEKIEKIDGRIRWESLRARDESTRSAHLSYFHSRIHSQKVNKVYMFVPRSMFFCPCLLSCFFPCKCIPVSKLVVDRWDYYIKPLLYGKYWKDELTYFPKFAGKENIDFINVDPKYWMFMKTHAAAIPYYEFTDFMKTQGSVKKRYYENVTLDMGPKF